MPDHAPARVHWDGEVQDRSTWAPPRPCERQARKAIIEELLLNPAKSPKAIASEVAERFKVSAKTRWADIRAVVRH